MIEWPSQSPDQNSIENSWGVLKNEVSRRQFLNKAELRFVKDEWQKMPIETCRKLISSMPNRMQKDKQNKGGQREY